MIMAKHKNHSILCAIFILWNLLVVLSSCTVPSSAPGTICGSYIAGAADAQTLFSVDVSQTFYYADQKNDRFILGRVSHQGEGAYRISCQDPYNAGILPDQELFYDGKGFSLIVEGELYFFQKIDDVPVVIGDISGYS